MTIVKRQELQAVHQPLGSYLSHLLPKYKVLTACFYRGHTSGDKRASISWTLHAAPGARLKRLLANSFTRQRPP